MKRIIWSYDVDIKDYQDYLDECHPDVDDETEKQALCEQLNDSYWDDEKINLNKSVDGIALASLGMWNGNHSGYKFFSNLNECLNVHCNGYLTVFVEDGQLQATESHHDGCNYYTFYRIKNEYSQFVHDNPDEVRQEMLEPLGKDVAEVYGW